MNQFILDDYILQSMVEEQLLKMGVQIASGDNYTESLLAVLNALTRLKRRRDALVFTSSKLAISQEGMLLKQ